MLLLQPSATRAVSETAARLRSKGIDVISLSTGEPDFISPKPAFEYAQKAMAKGKTKYTATAGITELREEVIKYYKKRFGLDYDIKNVSIGAGAKPLLFEAFATLLNPGDEVILTSPAWVSYIEQIRFFAAKAVIIKTNPKTFQFDIKAIENAITPRTRVFVLNSPHNPSGVLFKQDDIKKLCQLAIKHNFTIINDEVYERITFRGEYQNPLCYVSSSFPKAREHVLNINSVSKTYAMTGWRIGFAIGPSELIKRMVMLQGHMTSGASSISQWAALGAMREAQTEVSEMLVQYKSRAKLITRLLDEMPYLKYIAPQGAFYVFADISSTIGKIADKIKITDDISFCQILLEKAHLALVPGTAFLQPNYVRISFAASEKIIIKAMKNLHDFLAGLTG